MDRDGLLDKIQELTQAGYEVRFMRPPLPLEQEDIEIALLEDYGSKFVRQIVSKPMLEYAYDPEEVMIYALDHMAHQMRIAPVEIK